MTVTVHDLIRMLSKYPADKEVSISMKVRTQNVEKWANDAYMHGRKDLDLLGTIFWVSDEEFWDNALNTLRKTVHIDCYTNDMGEVQEE